MIGERIFPELNDYTVTVAIAPLSSANAYFRAYHDHQPLCAAMIGKRIFSERGNFPLAVKTNRKFGSVSISSSRSAEHRCD